MYYNVIIPFSQEKDNFGKELGIQVEPFVSIKDICKELYISFKVLQENIKVELQSTKTKFNSELKDAFRSCAEIVLKYTISKDIKILQRIKDKLRNTLKECKIEEKQIRYYLQV